MPQKIIIAEQLRLAALLTDERVDELIVAQGRYQIGDVFLGTIENVLPGIDAAFVNIGASEKNGFIHVSDLGPLRLKKNAAGINELLEPKQKVLVQVMKEPTGTKGPRLTGNLSLPGRYLVLQPNGQGVNISRKVSSESERNRLRALGVLIKPPGTGLLIRSEANNVTEELIINDLENLNKQWESIQNAAENTAPPILLNREEDFINRVLRDHAKSDLSKVIVDTSRAAERAKNFLINEAKNIIIEHHDNPINLLEFYKINTTIYNALNPRVDLPSGGYIIIEPTEALTVIDVNSGSFTRSANSRETVLWTNCEAAIEIARQLKLRNIGGVVIIDFIDMESRRDQLQLLEYFTSSIKDDAARPQIAQLTELGLVELTRKRQGQNIYELFSKACNNCNGLGHIPDIPKKEDLQPLAKKGGVIQSDDATKKQNIIYQPNITKAKDTESSEVIDNILPSNNSEDLIQSNDTETNATQKIPDLIGVKMNENEEHVYSELGLSPSLLLENEFSNKNSIFHVIRPGENEKLVLEEVQKQYLSNKSKRSKKNKVTQAKEIVEDNIDTENGFSEEEDLDKAEANDLIKEEKLSKSNLDLETTKSDAEQVTKKEENNELDEEVEEPRRRRRRSSAVNEEG